jgi:hypothetical protein
VGSIVGGIIAAVVGGALAVVTGLGVVSSVQDDPSSTGTEVVDYGSR